MTPIRIRASASAWPDVAVRSPDKAGVAAATTRRVRPGGSYGGCPGRGAWHQFRVIASLALAAPLSSHVRCSAWLTPATGLREVARAAVIGGWPAAQRPRGLPLPCRGPDAGKEIHAVLGIVHDQRSPRRRRAARPTSGHPDARLAGGAAAMSSTWTQDGCGPWRSGSATRWNVSRGRSSRREPTVAHPASSPVLAGHGPVQQRAPEGRQPSGVGATNCDSHQPVAMSPPFTRRRHSPQWGLCRRRTPAGKVGCSPEGGAGRPRTRRDRRAHPGIALMSARGLLAPGRALVRNPPALVFWRLAHAATRAAASAGMTPADGHAGPGAGDGW